MIRAATGLGIFFVLVILLLILPADNEYKAPRPQQTAATIATSTPSPIATTSPALTSPKVTAPKTNPQKTPVAAQPAPTTIQPVVPSITPPTLSFTDLNTKTRNAIVNILCETSAGSHIHGTSGSGVVISDKGIILTNAHLAEYFLLLDYPEPGAVDCEIRTGNPATNTYRAKLLYISPRWIENNSAALSLESPEGTGEYDYGLLLITATTNSQGTLPSQFPFVPLGSSDLLPGTQVLVAGYPAEFLAGELIERSLIAVSTIATVGDIYTFTEKNYDVFSIGGSILDQKGSSGSPAVSQDGTVGGILVTSTIAATTGERTAYAITANHIRRSFKEETNFDLNDLLNGNDQNHTADTFMTSIAPTLRNLITAHLPN